MRADDEMIWQAFKEVLVLLDAEFVHVADYVRLGICNSPSPGDFSQLVGQHPCSPQSSALPSVIHPLSYIILPSGILSAFPLRAGRQRVASSTLKSPSDKLANATTHEIHILARGEREQANGRRRQESGPKERGEARNV